jgi:hypothetical protein
MTSMPTIVRNPPDDHAFRQAVDDILASGVTDPGVAEERLRARFPRAVVRERDLASELSAVWYVYREGRWIPD